MKKWVTAIVVVLAAAVLVTAMLHRPAKPETKGQSALIGQTYRLNDAKKIDFALWQPEYTIDQVVISTDVYAADADQKLLVVPFTFRTSPPKDQPSGVSSHDFDLYAITTSGRRVKNVGNVGSDWTGHSWGSSEGVTEWEMHGDSGVTYSAFTAFLLGAKDKVAKIEVKAKGKTLTYEVDKSAKRLVYPAADPSDPDGIVPRKEFAVPAAYNLLMLPTGRFDVGYSFAGYMSSKAVDGKLPSPGNTYLVINLMLLSEGAWPVILKPGDLFMDLQTSDGRRLKWNGKFIPGDEMKTGPLELQPDEKKSFSVYFELPFDAEATYFRITATPNGRMYIHDVRQGD